MIDKTIIGQTRPLAPLDTLRIIPVKSLFICVSNGVSPKDIYRLKCNLTVNNKACYPNKL